MKNSPLFIVSVERFIGKFLMREHQDFQSDL